MTRVMSADEAQNQFRQVLDAVLNDGDTVIVERSDDRSVVVVGLEEYRRLTGTHNHQPDWWDKLLAVQKQFHEETAGQPRLDITAIIQEGRDERDREIDASLL